MRLMTRRAASARPCGKTFFEEMKGEPMMVVHFYRNNWQGGRGIFSTLRGGMLSTLEHDCVLLCTRTHSPHPPPWPGHSLL